MSLKESKELKVVNMTNGYVISPETGRAIKVGSKTYNRLMNNAVLKTKDSTQENRLIAEAKTLDEAVLMKNTLSKSVAGENRVVRRKGLKLYSVKRKTKKPEVIKTVADKSISALVKNRESLKELPDSEYETAIREMIYLNLVDNDVPKVAKRASDKRASDERASDEKAICESTPISPPQPVVKRKYRLKRKVAQSVSSDSEL